MKKIVALSLCIAGSFAWQQAVAQSNAALDKIEQDIKFSQSVLELAKQHLETTLTEDLPGVQSTTAQTEALTKDLVDKYQAMQANVETATAELHCAKSNYSHKVTSSYGRAATTGGAGASD